MPTIDAVWEQSNGVDVHAWVEAETDTPCCDDVIVVGLRARTRRLREVPVLARFRSSNGLGHDESSASGDQTQQGVWEQEAVARRGLAANSEYGHPELRNFSIARAGTEKITIDWSAGHQKQRAWPFKQRIITFIAS